jgi:hypothetical protein
MMDAPWFETYRLIALTLIYLTFLIQVVSVVFLYRQFKTWADDEAMRRERWAEDMAAVGKLREEAYHLRAQAEVALAQARQQVLRASERPL